MLERVNFNQLYYFWVIAQEGSIKKASKKLNLTPSGLSGQLRYLEEFFGKKLFDRAVRKLVLNDVGKIVFEYATNIFNQSDEMLRAVRQAKIKRQTLIQIGVLPSLSKSHIHEFILPLLRDRSIIVNVSEGSLNEFIYQIENDNLDIILTDRPAITKKTKIKSFKLKPRKIVAVGGKNFQGLKKKFPSSISGQPIIQLTKHSHLRSEIDDYFERHRIIPQIVGEADDVTLLRLAAEKGVCIAILPQNTVNESILAKRVLKLGELKGINSDMWAMMRSNANGKPILEKTIQKFLETTN